MHTETIYKVTNPATGEVEETFPTTTDTELEDIVTASVQAHIGWGKSAAKPAFDDRDKARQDLLDVRLEHLNRFIAAFISRKEDLARAITTEMGKPYQDALGEIDYCVKIYRYYVDHAHELLKPTVLRSDEETEDTVRLLPLGTVLGIMPWNFPQSQVARFIAPNLVLGNTVILKHAPQCPRSAQLVTEIFQAAGVPSGVFQHVYATNEQISQIIADPRINGVSLTGSDRAGSEVGQHAGQHVKKVVLELGGSDPLIVFDASNLDAAVEYAVSARYSNAGQSCTAAKRFIVHDDLYDEFLDRLTERARGLKVGDPFAEDTDYGPVSSLAAAERISEQIHAAVEAGATLHLAGGRKDCWIGPTILTDMTVDNPVSSQEIFGPVASVYRFSTTEEAISIANATPYGLGAKIITEDLDLAAHVADNLEAGMVSLNGAVSSSPAYPFGGIKRSGIGRELGADAIEELANKKLYMMRKTLG